MQVWEGAVSVDGRVDSDVRLALCCERTQELGARFYPNENRWAGAARLWWFSWALSLMTTDAISLAGMIGCCCWAAYRICLSASV